jgi:type IV pilus assembly protein PilQ
MKIHKVLFAVLVILVLVGVSGCVSAVRHRPATSPELPAMITQPEKAAEPIVPKPDTVSVIDYETQPKISNVWEDTEVKTVLQDCAAQSGINILSDDTVQGTVNLKIDNVPLEKALKMILAPLGYVFRKVGDYYLVGSGIPGSPGALFLSQSEEIITNRPAEEVAALLSSGLTPFVKATKGAYSLSVNAPTEIIDRIKSDIDNLDGPEQLVQIEVLVTEVTSNKGQNSGVDWSQIFNVSATGQGALKEGAATIYTGVIGGNLTSSIKKLALQGDLDLKAKPKVVTQNGKPAEFSVETGKYVILAENLPSTGGLSYFQRFEAKPITSGVNLKVTPRISRNGEVLLELEANVSDMSQNPENVQELPVVQSRKVKTTVRVKSDGTVVIGGLYQKLSRNSSKGVPFLDKIPGLGFLFGSKKEDERQTELVIFVTPQILK